MLFRFKASLFKILMQKKKKYFIICCNVNTIQKKLSSIIFCLPPNLNFDFPMTRSVCRSVGWLVIRLVSLFIMAQKGGKLYSSLLLSEHLFFWQWERFSSLRFFVYNFFWLIVLFDSVKTMAWKAKGWR